MFFSLQNIISRKGLFTLFLAAFIFAGFLIIQGNILVAAADKMPNEACSNAADCRSGNCISKGYCTTPECAALPNYYCSQLYLGQSCDSDSQCFSGLCSVGKCVVNDDNESVVATGDTSSSSSTTGDITNAENNITISCDARCRSLGYDYGACSEPASAVRATPTCDTAGYCNYETPLYQQLSDYCNPSLNTYTSCYSDNTTCYNYSVLNICYCHKQEKQICNNNCSLRCSNNGCASILQENCCNGLDDDGDGSVDGADSDCNSATDLVAGENNICWRIGFPYQSNLTKQSPTFSCPFGYYVKSANIYAIIASGDNLFVYDKLATQPYNYLAQYGFQGPSYLAGPFSNSQGVYFKFVSDSSFASSDAAYLSSRGYQAQDAGVKITKIFCERGQARTSFEIKVYGKKLGVVSVLSNAQVILTNPQTNQQFTCQTNNSGVCSILVPSGVNYSLAVSAVDYITISKDIMPNGPSFSQEIILSAVNHCDKCGDGIFNVCDQVECASLGDCVFSKGLFFNQCIEKSACSQTNDCFSQKCPSNTTPQCNTSQGLCECKPSCICSGDYAPVCGVDNKTYSNVCGANCAAVEVNYQGECSVGEEIDCALNYGADYACSTNEQYDYQCAGYGNKIYLRNGNWCNNNGQKINFCSSCDPKETFSFTLNPGWNAISFPLSPGVNTIGAIFSAIESKVETVKTFDSSINDWRALGDRDAVSPGKGYLVNIKGASPVNLVVKGDKFGLPTNFAGLYNLKQGINLIGLPFMSSFKISDIDFAATYSAILNNDNLEMPTTDNLSSFRSYTPGSASDFSYLTPGEAYWIKVEGEENVQVDFKVSPIDAQRGNVLSAGIAGAKVLIEPGGLYCITNSDGKCSISLIADEEYRAHATSDGYLCNNTALCWQSFTPETGVANEVIFGLNLLQIDICDDSDFGDIYTKGTVYANYYNASTYTRSSRVLVDECWGIITGGYRSVKEATCNAPNGAIEIIDCPYRCYDGACQKEQFETRFKVLLDNSSLADATINIYLPYSFNQKAQCQTDQAGECSVQLDEGRYEATVVASNYNCSGYNCFHSFSIENSSLITIDLSGGGAVVETGCSACGIFCSQSECSSLGSNCRFYESFLGIVGNKCMTLAECQSECAGETYSPVCAENGTEYSNACLAECVHVWYSQGPCQVAPPELINCQTQYGEGYWCGDAEDFQGQCQGYGEDIPLSAPCNEIGNSHCIQCGAPAVTEECSQDSDCEGIVCEGEGESPACDNQTHACVCQVADITVDRNCQKNLGFSSDYWCALKNEWANHCIFISSSDQYDNPTGKIDESALCFERGGVKKYCATCLDASMIPDSNITSAINGGTANFFGDNDVQIYVPVGAINESVKISIRQIPVNSPEVQDKVLLAAGRDFHVFGDYLYDVTFVANDGSLVHNFNQPIIFTLTYHGNDMEGWAENTMVLYRFDAEGNGWQAIPTQVDTIKHTLTAQTNHFSPFIIGSPFGVGLESTPCNDNSNCGQGLVCRCDNDESDGVKDGVCVKADNNVVFCPFTHKTAVEQIIDAVNKYLFTLILILAPLMILIGAVMMVLGRGEPAQFSKAKLVVIWACVGFGIALASKIIFAVVKYLISGGA